MFENSDLIHSYSRREAIDDGVLVDMSQEDFGKLAKEAGFKYPMAMTATAFEKYVELSEVAKAAGNDVKGRWWDVLYMLRHAISRQRHDGTTILFQVRVVVDSIVPSLVQLKAVIGPDDDGLPCFTIMLPEED